MKVFYYCLAYFCVLTVSSQTVVNFYAKVTAFPSCTPCFTVCDKVTVSSTTNFAVSDDVLLIQMKGASSIWNQDSTFGTILNYGSAGFHEVLTIANITGTQIQFTTAISGIYDPNFSVQLVKVFKQANYTVPAAGITAQNWDGNTGGVVYMDISGTLTLNGDINTSGKGFRGALNPNNNTKTYGCGTDSLGTLSRGEYYLNLSEIEFAGRKGEGIVEFRNPQFELGKGPLGNGGGGGINHNAGGGGGSNMGAGGQGGNVWEGYTCTYKGNGRGGNALNRMGGLRLFLGGGGGAGHENNNNGTSGGYGGGIIIIKAGTLQGNGFKMISDGLIGYNRNGIDGGPGGDDGAGGGGAGGSIKLDITNYGATAVTIQARGGNGGSVNHSGKHGTGGGGGGGLVCITAASVPGTVTTNSQGGIAGLEQQSTTPPDYYYAKAGTNGITAFGCSSLSLDPPAIIPFSLGGDLLLCVPPLATLNTGLSSPYGFKWYRNGTVLAGQTSGTLSVNGSGIYVAEVTTPLCTPMKDTINVSQKGSITPINAYFCNSGGPQNVTLSIGNTSGAANKYVWYDKLIGGTVQGSGTSLLIPNLNKDTVLYVEDTTKIITTIGPVDVTNAANSYYSSHGIDNESSRQFSVIAPLKIMSVDVKGYEYQGGCGASGSIKSIKVLLLKNGVAVDSTASLNITCAVFTTVPVGFNIQPGGGYELRIKGVGAGHYSLSGEKQSYKISDVIDIAPNYDYSGAFFNWKIQYGAVCGRLPVRAIITCATPLVFTGISAKEISGATQIDWSVVQQSKCERYILEQSMDGVNFTELVRFPCGETLGYSYVDGAVSQIKYYRVKLITRDNKIILSSIVNSKGKELPSFEVFPNPNNGSFEINTQSYGTFYIEIFNLLGQLVYAGQLVNEESFKTFKINLSESTKQELLVLKIYSDTESIIYTKKIMVK